MLMLRRKQPGVSLFCGLYSVQRRAEPPGRLHHCWECCIRQSNLVRRGSATPPTPQLE
jgi:hypothetical protein